MKRKKRIGWLLVAALLVTMLCTSWAYGAEKININTATAAELQTISGIGASLADRIVTYREKNGPFKTTEDLTQVKGIGQKKYETIKDQITVE